MSRKNPPKDLGQEHLPEDPPPQRTDSDDDDWQLLPDEAKEAQPSEFVKVEALNQLALDYHVHSSNELFNINCFEYLKILADAAISANDKASEGCLKNFSSALGFLWAFRKQETAHQLNRYGNDYSKFFRCLEEDLDNRGTSVLAEDHTIIEKMDHLLDAVFLNGNHALERAGVMLEDISRAKFKDRVRPHAKSIN